MSRPPPTSVLLPTVRWTDACDDVAAQLRPEDELLVVCDGDDDPVAARADELPDGVRLVRAGDPERCSGKANAVAAGMDAASNDRIVWTDDDFHHPPDWLSTLHADYERHGPVSEVPFFVGRDPLSVLVEPLYALGGTLGTHAGDKAWAGAALFERDDLDADAFLSELRLTVSDDGLLSEHLDATSLRRTRRVPVGGSVRESLERHVRFSKIVYRHEPRDMAVLLAVGAALTLAGALFPGPVAVLATLLTAFVYAYFGVGRWTVLLAYPAMMLQVPLFAYGLARRTFVWGGRRYRWPSKFDVRVVE
ncbi:Glycosyl transferase family 2 [Halogeometricum rufum]|uniref:Glycosyl transferase family 2 n=1 Tax=Halogeometricum rufum TaxID=553469 RepID=A0A1I6I699_9EURY|nr:glycosyltransferase family 2 protein [Halogeometricum rufum]SFR62256.1 Glycosyl transferase family 2 [Halogeometricum rufum]